MPQKEWDSLPLGCCGRPVAPMNEALKHFEEYLEKELAGETDLHIEYGFLEDGFK